MALVGTQKYLFVVTIAMILDENKLPCAIWQGPLALEKRTYGKDTKGLYRVHQFNKIEMVVIAQQDKDLTDKLHEEILGNAKFILQSLKHLIVKFTYAGDLGQGQVNMTEAWMPLEKLW